MAKHNNFPPEIRERMYKQEEYFRSKFLTFIDGAIGDEWHITFIPFTNGKYFIDVYAPSYQDALTAANIVISKFAGEYRFEGEYKGTIDVLINQYQIAA